MSKIEAENLFKVGQEYYQKKDYLNARTYFYKILVLYPENLSVLRKIALCYFYEKNFEQSELIIKKVIKIEFDSNAILMLIDVLERQDKVSEIIKWINLGIKEKLLDEKWLIREKTILPKIFKDKDDVKSSRNRLNQNLDEILNLKKNFI